MLLGFRGVGFWVIGFGDLRVQMKCWGAQYLFSLFAPTPNKASILHLERVRGVCEALFMAQKKRTS